ncbi:type II toxin-antitoxin system HicB family antitoxin [Saccharopolyspora sp. NPDC002376]
MTLNFDGSAEARAHFMDLLGAAERGERFRGSLVSPLPSRAQVVREDDGCSVFIPGLPVAADGDTVDEAIGEMVTAPREYADDWEEHLRDAPNHRLNWDLVQLVRLGDDGQLRDWLLGEGS